LTAEEAYHAELLGNRVAKRFRHLRKWAAREGIEAYRLYDRDIPEIPLSIDLYKDRLVVALYERPYERDPEVEASWLKAMVAAAAGASGVDPALCCSRVRRRQRGSFQYGKGESDAEIVIRERGLSFIVRPGSYLDTGLFLDHREARAMARAEAGGRRCLNLFCYTGSFSVYMAAGGASEVLSVDLSKTYLEWAGRNMAINGFVGPRYRFLRRDVLAYIGGPAAEGPFDLIVLAPPTFSNSKAMRGSFAVARDHLELIAACERWLAPRGILYFSCNARRFKLGDLGENLVAEDLSARSVSQDFRGMPHRLYRIRRLLP